MFWLIIGIAIGAFFFWLATRGDSKPRWYEWILIILGVILMLFGMQNYLGSQAELEQRAGLFMLLMFALPGLILAVIGIILPMLRGRKQPVENA